MLITTTSSVDGRPVQEYLGVINAQSIIGANLFKDIFAGLRDVFGGRSKTYEKVLEQAKEDALRELSEKAQALGANGNSNRYCSKTLKQSINLYENEIRIDFAFNIAQRNDAGTNTFGNNGNERSLCKSKKRKEKCVSDVSCFLVRLVSSYGYQYE